MKEEQIAIEQLWNQLVDVGNEVHKHKTYEVLDGNGIKILVKGPKYVSLVWLSRHKTSKHLVKIYVKTAEKTSDVVVTTDHVCMVYNRDHFFEKTAAKDLRIGDFVAVYDDAAKTELAGSISNIEDLGATDEWVYDCEVEDDMHAFYANDILVHNSQFVNLQCVSSWLTKTKDYPDKLQDWNAEQKRELWNVMAEFVDNEVNPFVRNLVHEWCYTNNPNMLTYELEYMSDIGIYEGKKHYATHKIFDEGDPVDYIKWSGIELKKAQVPKEMKAFLKDIYEGTILKKWKNDDYVSYVNNLYDKFKQFTIDELSFWKGYNTERQSVGFLQMQVGTTGIAKACTYYNQILQKLNLSKKYDELRVGDKVRFCYIDEGNPYKINCIAYKPGQWPAEFTQMFKPDYKKMFDKLILDPLKRFREATKFESIDPSKQVVQDIFNL